MPLPFTKMHGLGNDFVVLQGMEAPVAMDSARARQIADRRRGIGCDQILLIEPGRDGADFAYRVFNADGSEAGHCGNGIRCVARLLRDSGQVTGDVIRFVLGREIVETRLLANGHVQVNMGVPDFRPEAVPFRGACKGERCEVDVDGASVQLVPVSVGNPHAVIDVADVETAPVDTLGPRIERHSAFPDRTNVEFMTVVDRQHIRLRVWERGAGETLACGTGACAAAAAARREARTDERVEVALPGGVLVIEWSGGDNPLWMTGPAETVFHGTLTE